MASDPPLPRYGFSAELRGDVAVVVLVDRAARVEATVSPSAGGELVSLACDGAELLHCPSAASVAGGAWRGRAPVLFPAVGRQAGGRWPRGRMPLHGFAQDAAFDVVKSVAVGTKRLQRIAHKLQSLL